MISTRARIGLNAVLFSALCLPGCQMDGGSGGGRRMFGARSTERWTILCSELSGPYHRDNCEALAAALGRTPGIRAQEVRCEHDPDKQASRLFYGTYDRPIEADTGSRELPRQMRDDLGLIFELTDERTRRVFGHSRAVVYVQPVSDAKREWALIRAQGMYSLQIAVFYPEPGFTESRQAAVDFVAELRTEGHQAYYHHGDVRSMITVGLFGESAVIEGQDGKLILSPEVRALQASDPRFKYNYENGRVLKKKLGGTAYQPHSFLVKIPKPDFPQSGS